ncbi:inositol monophosphatase family protein [Arthrobacter sp. U41]|uniref:inositol monophosphatase family protein n=1 Tax=Arthrobacter sp. U41 TaxID=1849032 RepID=UPI00085936E8|nr:inositol monophosphatase family protein [Arthrobacter sp. U41]AOT05815.1 hypothetical protein ASPU41_20495 [Arthrobacter sp. U41]
MINSLSTKFATALEISVAAGELADRWYRQGGYRVTSKNDGSPVTEADRDIEQFIRRRLAQAFPEDGILGEEFPETFGESGGRWIIDPIDGTKSFIHGVPLYSTLMAYERDDEIQFGAINAPSAGLLVYAEKDRGCFSNGTKARVSERSGLGGSYVLATWLEDWDPKVIKALIDRGVQPRTWGDAYGYAMVATGQAEAIVDFNVQTYDLAPMPVIIREAGGIFTSLEGEPGISHGTGIATNGVLHEELLNIVGTGHVYLPDLLEETV